MPKRADGYEKIQVPKRLSTVNKFKVPAKQWRKWDASAQKLFNYVFKVMASDQQLFLHPQSALHAKRLWRTTCFNAAWIAADAHMRVA
jgi:hypothetical protein